MATLIKYKQLELVGKIKNADLGELILTNKLADGVNFIQRNGSIPFIANQSMGGFKITNLANGTGAADAINLSQLNALDVDLQTQIDNINTALIDGMKVPLPFNASTTSTFPNMPKGTTYKVTVAGVTSGVQLEVGDTIVYDTTGTTPYVVQSNLSQATESILGTLKISTQTQVDLGTDDTTAVTPLKLAARLANLLTTVYTNTDNRYVRYDVTQSLTNAQKLTARQNIGAADDSEVVKLSGSQTITGQKTFSLSPIIPAGTSANDAVNKGQLDAAILASGMENFIINEVPSGALNSSNLVFTLANTPIIGKKIIVTLNGQELFLTEDYTISANTITFVLAPESTDIIRVSYIKS